MKSNFRSNGIITFAPESEVECYALHYFIENFKIGLSKIEISRDTVWNESVVIKVDSSTKIAIIEEVDKN